jgi:DNA-directed RNA polymerase, subunit N (RpoN/RPB10)
MLIPVRCFTCGASISRHWDEYKRRVEGGEKPDEVLNSLGIKRYCCRRMFISAFEYADEYLQFVKAEEKIQVSEFPKEEAEQQQVTKGRRGRKRKFL